MSLLNRTETLIDPSAAHRWPHLGAAHLLLLECLLLVLLHWFLLVSVLFGTTFQKLLGKVFGLGSVPQVGPDVVVHLVR